MRIRGFEDIGFLDVFLGIGLYIVVAAVWIATYIVDLLIRDYPPTKKTS